MRKIFKKKGILNKTGKSEKVVGDIRQSQLITSFGCGAIVDFIHDTVMIAGTDHWKWADQSHENPFIIHNENLQSYLRKDFFLKPKVDMSRKPFFADKSKDIPAYRFPEMLYCTKCHSLHHYTAFDHQSARQMTCNLCGEKAIIASRFVVVCEKGHIEDFPYSEWVHLGNPCPKSSKPRLALFNIGGKSGIDSLYVKCNSCGALRGMKSAFHDKALNNVKKCSAKTPWLAKSNAHNCDMPLKTRLRTSSNVHFPVTVSALSIPPWSKSIFKELERYYSLIDSVDDKLAQDIIEKVICPKFTDITKGDIYKAFKKLQGNKRDKVKKTQQEIYHDEYLAFTIEGTTHEDSEGDFSVQLLPAPKRYENFISKVVAVDKLTEVVALIGFTRIKPWSGKVDDENIAPLSSIHKNWLPGVEMKGEGIFIEFNMKRLREWSDVVRKHYEPMRKRLEQSYFFNARFSPQYVLLHTFSHLLIRQLSLECGYGAASLKEKIYSTFHGAEAESEMAAVLIYTSAPDADGSLGGLVEQAFPDRLGIILDNMLAASSWCSNDPLCINTFGEQGQGYESLNYSACHACTLLPETSCEFRNLLLDRSSLIGRPDNSVMGFFGNIGP